MEDFEQVPRADEATGQELLAESGVRPFKFGARAAMKTWFLAGGEALADDDNLARLLGISSDYVNSLPPKQCQR